MRKLLTVAVLAGAGLVLTTSAVNAYRGDANVKGPDYTSERHEAMTQAFESNNYQAWKDAVGDRPMAQRITEDNFGKFAEMRKLRAEGKTEETNQVRAELGFGLRNGSGQKTGGTGDGQGYRGGLAK